MDDCSYNYKSARYTLKQTKYRKRYIYFHQLNICNFLISLLFQHILIFNQFSYNTRYCNIDSLRIIVSQSLQIKIVNTEYYWKHSRINYANCIYTKFKKKNKKKTVFVNCICKQYTTYKQRAQAILKENNVRIYYTIVFGITIALLQFCCYFLIAMS